MAKRTRRGQKLCPKCGAWVKGTRSKTCSKCSHQFNGKPTAVPTPELTKAGADKPTKAGDAITIAQILAVAKTVTVVGGFDRFHELLGVIRDVGGLRRMKDLLDAMSAAETDRSKV